MVGLSHIADIIANPRMSIDFSAVMTYLTLLTNKMMTVLSTKRYFSETDVTR